MKDSLDIALNSLPSVPEIEFSLDLEKQLPLFLPNSCPLYISAGTIAGNVTSGIVHQAGWICHIFISATWRVLRNNMGNNRPLNTLLA